MRIGQTLKQLDARIWISAVLVAALCANFWLGSRYPSLQGKASADPNEALATPLGFEAHFPEPPPSDALLHLLWVAWEWALTNKAGMTFGLLLAAGLLTLMPLLPQPRSGRYVGAFQGVLIGTPLGVCVNCAAPVADGMLRSGSRTEVALGALFASPSFNVIVLSMLLSMFPWHFVALKLAASMLLVFLLVPWLAKLAERPGWRAPLRPPRELPGTGLLRWLDKAFSMPAIGEQKSLGLGQGLIWVLINYPRNLLRIVALALPLMLLAGLLGAVLVELLPWDKLAYLAQLQSWWQIVAVLLLACVFGTLLPVPIAFDVVICSVLWNAGVPAYIVVALLITLGTFSIYPWSLLGSSLSWKLASLIAALVALLGLLGGSSAALLQAWHEIDQQHQAQSRLASIETPPALPTLLPRGRPAAELQGLAAPLPEPRVLHRGENWSLSYQPHQASSAGPQNNFSRIDGSQLGLERLPLPRPYQQMEPTIMHLGALASADVDNDGWPDLAQGSFFGVWLYRNLGGQFVLQQIDFPAMRDWIIADVALRDLDGDGWQDLIFGTWMQGTHVLFNQQGHFSAAAHLSLPRGTETLSATLAFADLDRDGDLDLITGGSSFAAWFFYPAVATNTLWRNQGQRQFTAEPLDAPEGDTLSLLFTDLNDDHWPDLLVANDFDEPDRVYMNRQGRLHSVTARESRLPYTTTTSMSYDSGDINNDGTPEIYSAQIAMGRMDELHQRLADPYRSCASYADVADRSRCDAIVAFQIAVVQARNVERISHCDRLADPTQQRDCVVTAYHWNRIIVRQPSIGATMEQIQRECAAIPDDFQTMRDLCAAMSDSRLDYNQSAREFSDELPQIAHSNLLYGRRGQGFVDLTPQWRAGFGGWSWNARFGDLNNDGWLDLHVSQGSRLRASSAYSPVYINQQGRGFADRTHDLGLSDHRPTGASLLVDYDRDGDLDVISYPFLLTPVVWRNNHNHGDGISLQLDNANSANRQGVGARIQLLRTNASTQQRDIKASGGYQSHFPALAHFGLGGQKAASGLRVRWPDGHSLTLDEELPAGQYRLRRD